MSEQEKLEESSSEPVKKTPSVREDWYQTEAQVVLVLLAKNVDASSFVIDIQENNVHVKFPMKTDIYEKTYNLSHSVLPSKCAYKVYSTKIEIKLAKADGLQWSKLEKEVVKVQKKIETRNWDRVVAEYEDDQPEGEAALNALFQRIYNEGSDEVKKAMNKSFLESGGTELNTNWDSVKNDKVSIKPPEGMEWKTWDK